MAQEEQKSSLVDILSAAQSHGLSLIDISPFLSESFDPQQYANNIIEAPNGAIASTSKGNNPESTNNNWVPQSGRKDLDVEGDVSVALSRLNLAIDDVDRLIREEVTTHANDLLAHTSTLLALRPSLAVLTDSLRALQDHQNKLIQRVSVPRASLTLHTTRLFRMRSAQSLVKSAERFVRLVKRLQGQMKNLSAGEKKTTDRNRLEKLDEMEGEGADGIVENDLLDAELGEEKERGLSMAALTLSEITTLVDPYQKRPPRQAAQVEQDSGLEEQMEITLLSLDFVKEMLPIVEEAREKVTNQMEDMVVRGLRDLSPTLLSTSLQTAFNLGQLADLVRDLLADLNDVIRDRVAAAFDMQALSRELGTKEPSLHQTSTYSSYRSKRGQTQMENAAQTPQIQKWNAALWARFDTLIVGEMGAVCSKVYTLERVLSLKTDRLTGTNYLKEAMSVLGDRPSSIFWATLSKAMDSQSRQWIKSSSFLSQTMATSYPRLLRLFHEFFEKVSVYAESVHYTFTLQSSETLLLLKSLGSLQEIYLARSKARLDNHLTSSFQSHQRIAGSQEGQMAARMAWEEIDRANFDPILLKDVTHMVQAWLVTVVKSISDQQSRDPSAFSLQRTTTSSSQLNNANLTNAVYALKVGLQKVLEQRPEECQGSIGKIFKEAEHLYRHDLTGKLLTTTCKEISDTFAKMHYVDFGVEHDAVLGGSGASAYMSDLSERLWYIREQLLVHYSVDTDKTAWILRIAQHALRSFVLQASLIRPLGEGGKLKLTSDMTELEFAISQLLGSSPAPCPSMSDCGSDFKALRAFRAMIFKDNLSDAFPNLLPAQSGLALFEVAHHIIVRSKTILLPHELHKWSRIEYLKWLDNHTNGLDVMQLIQGCLDAAKADEFTNVDDTTSFECLDKWLRLSQSGDTAVEHVGATLNGNC